MRRTTRYVQLEVEILTSLLMPNEMGLSTIAPTLQDTAFLPSYLQGTAAHAALPQTEATSDISANFHLTKAGNEQPRDLPKNSPQQDVSRGSRLLGQAPTIANSLAPHPAKSFALEDRLLADIAILPQARPLAPRLESILARGSISIGLGRGLNPARPASFPGSPRPMGSLIPPPATSGAGPLGGRDGNLGTGSGNAEDQGESGGFLPMSEDSPEYIEVIPGAENMTVAEEHQPTLNFIFLGGYDGLTVYFSWTGTTSEADCGYLPISFTLSDTTGCELFIDVVDDEVAEQVETLTLQLEAGPGYLIEESTSSATYWIEGAEHFNWQPSAGEIPLVEYDVFEAYRVNQGLAAR